jgi:hypothetical protein
VPTPRRSRAPSSASPAFDCSQVGITGVERGLGRAHVFRLSDFDKRTPIATRPPRFEMSSLLAASPANRLNGSSTTGLVPESTCVCSACANANSISPQLAPSVRHDAAMYERLRDRSGAKRTR